MDKKMDTGFLIIYMKRGFCPSRSNHHFEDSISEQSSKWEGSKEANLLAGWFVLWDSEILRGWPTWVLADIFIRIDAWSAPELIIFEHNTVVSRPWLAIKPDLKIHLTTIHPRCLLIDLHSQPSFRTRTVRENQTMLVISNTSWEV